MKIDNYLHLYIGADTNFGKLTGVMQGSCFFSSGNGEIKEHKISGEEQVKLILKRINNLTPAESTELNKKGFSIGRPKGYSFTPEAILFLLSLHVDLFGLIDNGLAIEMNSK